MSQTNGSAINPSTINFLLSAAGIEAANALAKQTISPQNELAHLAALRRQFQPEEAGALLSLIKLRKRATVKFPHADQLFFDPEALEQATTWQIATYRANSIHQRAPQGPILDLGCGIGGDTLALAQHRQVIAYERDETRIRIAQANAKALNLDQQIDFRHADWLHALNAAQLPNAAAAYIDPARRVDGRRIFSLHQTEPPLAAIRQLQQRIPALCVKTMPGISDDELPADCNIEFISHQKTCKEAILWFGELRPIPKHDAGAALAVAHAQNVFEEKMPNRSAPHNQNSFPNRSTTRHATVYINPTGWQHITSNGTSAPVGDLASGQYLHEPDPAVIRAGAFAELCTDLNAHLFDPQIAYLVTDQAGTHPLTQSFQILEILPFSMKQLNRRLKSLNIGQVELKKRGFPTEPEQLRSKLKLANSNEHGAVIFTRQNQDRIMIIARRIKTEQQYEP